jgi:predicted dehydrogenase
MTMTNTIKPGLYALDADQHARVLAALRLYKERIKTMRADGTTLLNGPMDASDIDAVIQSLSGPSLEFSAIVPLFAESAEDSAYVRTAQENAREGEFEVDEPAVVSRGDDDGAYVMGWMWVSNDDAGLTTYWTIQLDVDIPEGGFVIGGKLPDEPIWYFGDEDELRQAEEYAKQLGFGYTKDVANTLPEEQEFTDEVDDFKQHAAERAAQRERY